MCCRQEDHGGGAMLHGDGDMGHDDEDDDEDEIFEDEDDDGVDPAELGIGSVEVHDMDLREPPASAPPAAQAPAQYASLKFPNRKLHCPKNIHIPQRQPQPVETLLPVCHISQMQGRVMLILGCCSTIEEYG
jgi:hypothetical protein